MLSLVRLPKEDNPRPSAEEGPSAGKAMAGTRQRQENTLVENDS